MHVLGRFCQRNGIQQRHVDELLESPRNMMQLVILEREADTDKLNHDCSYNQCIVQKICWRDGSKSFRWLEIQSDSDSISDYATGLVGFLQHKLIEPFVDDRHANGSSNGKSDRFVASRNHQYAITEKGKRVAGWITDANGTVNGDLTTQQRVPSGVARDSNTNRMTVIIRDPALRLLFREYLCETHCEENLSFYVEVRAFLADYEAAKKGSSAPRLDMIRETLAAAYRSPCELNIDHTLRNALAARMTRAVGEDQQMVESLDEVAALFDQAQNSVFKLMASDSVPKFSREPKYANMLKERNLEGMFAAVSL
ncbi:hypothetical protein MRB53_037440 [Persea americana]|nr:hypothetical protein MRB53_037440 [Persea americana]